MAHPFGKSVETAPMIRATWGEALSPVIAAIIVARPHLGHRFALAPRRVMHALAASVSTALERNLDP